MEAEAERVPSWRVLAALGLRVLPPAGLCGPHLHRTQHPQEARSAGCHHSRRDCGIQANCGELIPWPQTGLQRNNHTKEMSIFLMKLSGLFFFFFKLNLSQDVEDITLINKVTPWVGLLRNSKAKNTFLKVLLFNCLMFMMIHREHFNLVSVEDNRIRKCLIFQFKW